MSYALELVLGGTWPLVELEVSGNKLGAAGAELVTSTRLPALRALTAGGNEGQGAWAVQLGSAKHLEALEYLDLSARMVGDTSFGPSPDDWVAFARTTALPSLQTLVLRGNDRFEDSATIALANNAALAQLVDLDLAGTGVTMTGLAALAASPHVKPKRIAIPKRLADAVASLPGSAMMTAVN